MLGGADNPNGELPSYITGADSTVFMGFFEQDLRGRVKGNVHVDSKTGKRL
ncbi:hypothetical protein PS052_09435 [Escherichia albertii]|uniref:hypothetical protein n=1 Tax=Escherichia albertii TaxID=208962 RepID=UPI00235E9506|nr:hypothetical protein [Escherichia albertii]WDB40592.1 hypothetical protein PS052_09435 [Escherichia albertii]WKU82595.1 hypothetical protein MJ90_10190 [Escherichia albertii]